MIKKIKVNKLETNCKNCIHVNVCSPYEKVEAIILERPVGYNFNYQEATKVYRALAEICKNFVIKNEQPRPKR